MSDAINLEHFSRFRSPAIEIIHKHAAGCVLNEEPAFQYGVRCSNDSLNRSAKRERSAFGWKGYNVCGVGQRIRPELRKNSRLSQQESADETDVIRNRWRRAAMHLILFRRVYFKLNRPQSPNYSGAQIGSTRSAVPRWRGPLHDYLRWKVWDFFKACFRWSIEGRERRAP